MSNQVTNIKVEELDGNYIFSSDRRLNGDNLVYDLNSVKEIFELNPIPSIEIHDNGDQKLNFDIQFEPSTNNFLVVMFFNDEAVSSEILTTVDMLDMLIEAYSKNTYITSNPILTSKTSKLLNEYVISLLKECKVPQMKFALEGNGEVKHNNKRVAFFERAMLNPIENRVLLCECVGDIPENTPLTITIETSIGVTIEIQEMLTSSNQHGQVMDIKYVELQKPVDTGSLIDAMNLLQNEEFEYTTTLNTLTVHNLITGGIDSVIKSCVQELNKSDNETLVNFVRNKKDTLFANEEQDHLIDQVDDLFDDLF